MIYLPYFGISEDMREHIYAQAYGFIPHWLLDAARKNWRGGWYGR